jgi:serine/threonine protein phosphatase PrpC
MGGHESGEIASRLAVDVFADGVTRAFRGLQAPGRKLAQRRAEAQELVRECTRAANSAIRERGREATPGEDGEAARRSQMGTTVALVLVVSDFAVVANVGDSRVYRARDGVLEQLSEDHTIVAETRAKHAADPRPRRKRKFVTRALGTQPTVEPELRLVNVFPGDLFLLCSDGLTDVVADEEIGELLRRGRGDCREAVRALIKLANRRGGPDNVTVVLVEVVGDADDDEDTEDLQRM